MFDTHAVIDGVVHERQRMLESLPERSGTIGGQQFRTVPFEELDAELRLESPHALADGRGGDSKLQGRSGKVSMPGARRQHAQ